MILLMHQMETFVIEKGARSFPCLAIYQRREMTFFSSGLSDLSEVSRALSATAFTYASTASLATKSQSLSSLVHNASSSQPARLFISGDRSSVGKSTCCLLLLASLIHAGVQPEELAYIKPITQCEAEQPVVKFCDEKGIANRGIGEYILHCRCYIYGV